MTTTTSHVRILKAMLAASNPKSGGVAYLAPLVQALRPSPATSVPTLGVTQRGKLYYNEDWVSRQTDNQLRWVIVHEVYHLLVDHHGRAQALGVRGGKAAQLWNQAADMEVNSGLASVRSLQGCEPQDPKPLMPQDKKWQNNLTAERYYSLLCEEDQEPPSGRPQQGDDGEGDQGVGAGSCGGAAGGEDPDDQQEGDDENGDDPGAAQVAVELAREDAKQQATASRGKQAGSMPGFVSAWLAACAKPAKVAWPRVLGRLLGSVADRARGCSDYDYARPSPRQAALGWEPGTALLPRGTHDIPRVTLAIDTSGSMSDDAIAEIANEVRALCRNAEAELTVLTFDTRIHQVFTGRDAYRDLVKQGAKGRGGTNFVPVFEHAQDRRRPSPDLLVLATDGYGPAPAHAPGKRTQVLWLLTKGGHRPVTYGRQLEMQ